VNGKMTGEGAVGSAMIRFWHKADISIAPSNVGF
jgi:hypothetical protein